MKVSDDLQGVLQAAYEEAKERKHEYLTPEHILYAAMFFDVAREIREKHKLVDLPILMLTSIHKTKKVPYRFTPDEDYLPVDVFLDKPIDPEQLVGVIQEMLGKRREEPEHPL